MAFCEHCKLDPITSGLGHLVGCPEALLGARAEADSFDLLGSTTRPRWSHNAGALGAALAECAQPGILKAKMCDTVTVCALKEAEDQEHARQRCIIDVYSCPGCKTTDLSWAGALLIHLLGCADYRRLVETAK